MKQLFLSGQGQIEVLDAPVPGRLSGGVLVRSAFSLISSGTEGAAVTRNDGMRGLYEKLMTSRSRLDQVWAIAQAQGMQKTLELVRGKLADYTPLGYSCAGVAVEVDSEGLGILPGQRVACMGAGFASHAEYVAVPRQLLVPLPDTVSLEEASFGALACIAMQGIRRLELSPGERVGIVGLGLIGQIALRLAESMGYMAYGFDISAPRVQHAKAHSTAMVFDTLSGGPELDGIVICASAKDDALVNQAFELCRKRGRVSIVGDVGLHLERAKMYAKELELRLSCSYGAGRYDPAYELDGHDYPLPYVRWTEGRNLACFIDLLARKKLDITDLISARVPVDSAKEAYAKIKSGNPDIYGVLLDYALPATPAISEEQRLCRYAPAASVTGHPIRLGLIGTGAYAKNVHIPNIGKIDALRIHAVASRSGASAAVIAKKTQAAYATSDYQKLLDDPEIDAVVISTRHATHARMTKDALQAGKHVFVEKPMAITLADCAEIEALAREKGKILRVGFNRRFSPWLAAMKKAVGTAGPRLLHIRVNVGNIGNHWSNTAEEGGRLLGEGVHFFDLANWLLDGRPVAVSAQAAGEVSPLNPNVSVNIRYDNGSIANVIYTSLGHTGLGKEYVELFGNGKSAAMDDYKHLACYGCSASVSGKEKGNKGQLGALREFSDRLAGKPNSTEGADAQAGSWATAIALAAYRSAESGTEERL